MKKEIGVWIDHRKAVIAFPEKGQGKLIHVDAENEEYSRLSSGLRSDKSAGSMDRVEQDGYQRNVQEHLAKFYNKVIAAIGEVDSVMIFGPGEAKGELKKRIEMEKPAWHIVKVQPADRMTDNEIVAKVFRYFSRQTLQEGLVDF